MMKRKLVIVSILCFGLMTLATAGNGGGDKKKGSVPAKKSTVSKTKKTTQPNVKTILRDTVMSPSKLDPNAGLSELFEASSLTSTTGVRLNPRAVSFVEDYMESHAEDLLKMKGWALPYFNMIDGVFKKHGLPTELKYLAVIESKLKSTATSRVGAVGPWQFMPGTARTLGLTVNSKVDERTNYYKSTVAAARYLKDLYAEFGDWLLVIAAYNGGPGYVYSAMRKSGSKNFWAMQWNLPNETRNHVKKFIGTHYVFEGQGGITTLTKTETAEQLAAVSQWMSKRNLTSDELKNSRTMKVSGKYYSVAIANSIVMEISEFERYNPNFDKVMASADNSYELKLPADKMESFVNNKYQILNESVQLLLNSATASNNAVTPSK